MLLVRVTARWWANRTGAAERALDIYQAPPSAHEVGRKLIQSVRYLHLYAGMGFGLGFEYTRVNIAAKVLLRSAIV